MNNLVDTSAWIEYFKGNKKYAFLSNLILTNTICTNDIVLSELLPSIIYRREDQLADLLDSLNKYRLTVDWQEVRDIQLLNIKHGNNNIGVADIIIAQNCMQNNLKLIAHDKQFEAMSKYITLKL